jgi:3-methyl-2-oxobutanoate hydroxymethyltransferase
MAPSNSPDSSVSAELPAPYGSGPTGSSSGGAPKDGAAHDGAAKDGAAKPVGKIRTHHLRQAKLQGERFAMLTAYDQYTAEIFDQAGIEVLLVGDSASNNVFGNETSRSPLMN